MIKHVSYINSSKINIFIFQVGISNNCVKFLSQMLRKIENIDSDDNEDYFNYSQVRTNQQRLSIS